MRACEVFMLHEFDHRVLGQNYDLFSFFPEGPGLPVWHERGLRIKNALIELWRKVHRQAGYQEIQSPQLLDKSLCQRSGHCDYFEEHMYFSEVDGRSFAIKPMNCPGAILLFAQKKRSHAELPLRLAELGQVHRHENSGSLHGLMRVRGFVQDDAHIFCREDQLLEEVCGVIRLIERVMRKCGMQDFRFELSLKGPGKAYLGSEEEWQLAQARLEEALQRCGYPVDKKEGEAKFYGPSLDLHLKDVHGRSWQCSSIQLDFNLPRRFQLCYYDEHGARQVPYMLHRAIYGSLERFIGILLENYGRDLPAFMHPVRYRVLSIGVDAYAREVHERLLARGVAAELDVSARPLKEKMRRVHEDMVLDMILVGPKEEAAGEVLIKRRASGEEQRRELAQLGLEEPEESVGLG